jgi:hypothetical protein
LILLAKRAFSPSLKHFAYAELIENFFYQFETLEADRSFSSLKDRFTFPG